MMHGGNEFSGRVGFCVGTGRCGTTFLAALMAREPGVASAHERERLGATFHMFFKWHGLPIDSEGFLANKEADVRRDLADHRFSFESSALLSHSLAELFDRFDARFLLLVRRPEEAVASFAVRGWYTTPYRRKDATLPPSFQECEHIRHFLGRNVPNGPEFERWSGLTQIGKLAWFWQARNRAILEQFRSFPPEHCRIERLENLDFERYLRIARFFGVSSQIDSATFEELAAARLNASEKPPRRWTEWSAREAAEFESEAAAVAEALGYEYRLESIRSGLRHEEKQPLSVPEVIGRVFS
jgi:hypothetical protein